MSWFHQAETVLAFRTEESQRSEEQKALIERFNQRLDEEIHAEASSQEAADLEDWQREIDRLDASRPDEPPRAYVFYEESPQPSSTRILERGDPASPGPEVQPGVPTVFGTQQDQISRLGPIKAGWYSSGRRLWLARWLTHQENPLAARVMANRVWQWLFGEGLVNTENDFGLMGQPPSHPELLDYLAVELIHSGWSIKHLQQLILKSNTFRRSTVWNPAAGKLDPENTLLWRWQPRRLEAEVVRDSMLAVSGTLNPAMYGPSMYPKLPESVLAGQSQPGLNWKESEPQEVVRRSIYVFVKRSLAVPELELLDAPDTTSSCEQRPVSTTGPQALTFLNGDFAHGQARRFADRLEREMAERPRDQVRRAFELALARPPTPAELSASLGFLTSQQQQIEVDLRLGGEEVNQTRLKALRSFCLTLLNANEFFYPTFPISAPERPSSRLRVVNDQNLSTFQPRNKRFPSYFG